MTNYVFMYSTKYDGIYANKEHDIIEKVYEVRKATIEKLFGLVTSNTLCWIIIE